MAILLQGMIPILPTSNTPKWPKTCANPSAKNHGAEGIPWNWCYVIFRQNVKLGLPSGKHTKNY